MKNTILLFLCIAFSSTLPAQKTAIGVKAGLTHTSLRGDAVNTFNNLADYTGGILATQQRTGIFAGAYVNLPVGEHLQLEPGIYYAQKGYGVRAATDIKGLGFLSPNARATLNAHYIDLPVLVKGQLGALQIFAGPQVSYLANADIRTTAGALGINLLDKRFEVTDQLSRWDAGVTGGVGVLLKNGLTVSATYERGLVRTDAVNRMNAFHEGVRLGVGFQF